MLARWHAAALALLLLPAAPTRAEEDPYSKPALYGGVGGTFTWQLFDQDIGTPGQVVTVNNTQGFELFLGYRASPYVGGEVQIDSMNGFNAEVGTQNTDIDLLSTTFNLKGYLPAGRLQPFLLLGVGYLNVDSGSPILTDDGNGLVTRFGSGLDVYLTDNFAVYAGWHYLLPFGDNSQLDTLSVHFGIQYMLRFLEP
jgi:opacity protein-like surface antigen